MLNSFASSINNRPSRFGIALSLFGVATLIASHTPFFMDTPAHIDPETWMWIDGTIRVHIRITALLLGILFLIIGLIITRIGVCSSQQPANKTKKEIALSFLGVATIVFSHTTIFLDTPTYIQPITQVLIEGTNRLPIRVALVLLGALLLAAGIVVLRNREK